ncbi:MAG TPA: aldehyde dehydrogenase family protein [Proteiniclasticum sp.]|nr:aldehyde dehydrogenase family protein [Proteiniclasticum sp.]
MNIENIDIERIVLEVCEKLQNATAPSFNEDQLEKKAKGIYNDPNEAIEKAYLAQRELFEMTLSDRKRITDSIKSHLLKYVRELSQMVVAETGMGNVKDKIIKNTLAIEKTPSTEDLRAGVFTGDDGLTLLELSPFGVIGAITPSTNPTETVICNTIGMVAAGNSVVFAPHPGAYKSSNRCVELINEAIIMAKGPKNLVVIIDNPSIEKSEIVMKHKKINLLCATGGPALVKAVLSSGKKAIGAGAGNPPVFVEETANIEKAAKDIVDGASFDNNLPCISEKEAIVMDRVFDYLVFNMKSHGAYEIKERETIDKLQKLLVPEKWKPNRKFIGKDAKEILKAIGIDAEDHIRLIIMEVEEDHPFVIEELMMPVLPMVRVNTVKEGIDLAVKVEHGFRHTAICHSKDIDVLTEMGHRIQTTIFVKNGPSYAGIGVGGEGYTTFTIAGPTGEGLTSASTFTRKRRCALIGGFTIR